MRHSARQWGEDQAAPDEEADLLPRGIPGLSIRGGDLGFPQMGYSAWVIVFSTALPPASIPPGIAHFLGRDPESLNSETIAGRQAGRAGRDHQAAERARSTSGFRSRPAGRDSVRQVMFFLHECPDTGMQMVSCPDYCGPGVWTPERGSWGEALTFPLSSPTARGHS